MYFIFLTSSVLILFITLAGLQARDLKFSDACFSVMYYYLSKNMNL